MKNKETFLPYLLVPVAFWFVIFFWKPAPFWLLMAPATFIMAALALWIGKREILGPRPTVKDISLGVLSALVLYGVFYLGNFLAVHILPGAAGDIGAVYGIRSGTPLALVGLLLLFIIGPAEVIFWQGFVQSRWMEKVGKTRGYLYTLLIYGGIHLWSGNPMLILAALVAGAFWGGLYAKGWPLSSLIISHAVWDCIVLVVFPIH